MKIVDIEMRERPIEEEASAKYSFGQSINNLHSKSDEFTADIQRFDLR